MKLKIYRAADAFLYLPTYIAYEYQIFETLLEPLGIDKVEFVKTDKEGDVWSIIEMVKENQNSDDSISIAIADPSSILSTNHITTDQKDVCRVIGAIINKLPFWGVNHIDKEFTSIDDFQNNFETVIHYKKELVTGYYLGMKLCSRYPTLNGVEASFGNEISLLEKMNNNNSKTVAISADIISIIKATNRRESPLVINYSFSNKGNYLTTGIITSNEICDKHGAILSKVIEAIQKSIGIIYSSEKIASNVLKIISETQYGNSEKIKPALNSSDFKCMVKLIKDESFYPANLKVTEEGWIESVKALGKTQVWDNEDLDKALNYSFNEYVDNRFVLNSEKNIAKQFGITKDTFSEEINCLVEPLSNTVDRLNQEKTSLSKELENKDNELNNLNTNIIAQASELSDLKTEQENTKEQLVVISTSKYYIPYLWSWLIDSLKPLYKLKIILFLFAPLLFIMSIYCLYLSYFAWQSDNSADLPMYALMTMFCAATAFFLFGKIK